MHVKGFKYYCIHNCVNINFYHHYFIDEVQRGICLVPVQLTEELHFLTGSPTPSLHLWLPPDVCFKVCLPLDCALTGELPLVEPEALRLLRMGSLWAGLLSVHLPCLCCWTPLWAEGPYTLERAELRIALEPYQSVGLMHCTLRWLCGTQ